MITVHLNSAAAGQGEWRTFPALMDGGTSALEAGDGTDSIAMADSGHECLDRHLAGKTVQPGKGLLELDFLASRMEGLPAKEQQVFLAALDIENPGSLAEMVNLSCNLDKFALYEGADTEAKLGEYVLKKDYKELSGTLADLLDVESIGRKYAQGHGGRFAPGGYVARTGAAIAPVYGGGELPDPLYDMESVFEVQLYGNKDRFTLFLPATENQMECAGGRMRLESMEGPTGCKEPANHEKDSTGDFRTGKRKL